jgi:SOS-response transcriptional repressor LexA
MPERNPLKKKKQTNGQNAVGLTARQAEIARAIEGFIAAKGYSPSIEEIGEVSGGIAKPVARLHLDRLCRLGLFRREPGSIRSIVRTDVPYCVKEGRA